MLHVALYVDSSARFKEIHMYNTIYIPNICDQKISLKTLFIDALIDLQMKLSNDIPWTNASSLTHNDS